LFRFSFRQPALHFTFRRSPGMRLNHCPNVAVLESLLRFLALPFLLTYASTCYEI
jgi:hypothetical protein